MELIRLSPRLDVDPSLRLRSPGEVLRDDYLRPQGINLSQLARQTGLRTPYVRELIAGTRPVRPAYAIRLAIVLYTSPLYWLLLQARYDLARAAHDDTLPRR